MKTENTVIKCPECNSDIIINTFQLLQGVKFTCHMCKTQIGLASESKNDVQKALDEFSKIKK